MSFYKPNETWEERRKRVMGVGDKEDSRVKDRITDGMGITKEFAVKVESYEQLKALNPSMPEDLLQMAWARLRRE